jgi:peptide/nickel transport system substrate-binding protein
MVKFSSYISVAILILFGTLTACTPEEVIPEEENILATAWAAVTIDPVPTSTPIPTPTPVPPSVLSVCMGQEPSSLFLYGDASAAGSGIRQAIYDGPFDTTNGEVVPVILQQIPSLDNGDAELRPVQVQQGTIIMDAFGEWVSLQEGVRYRPSGCLSPDCALIYEGGESVPMDELVVRFHLMPNILWSDGNPLTADDSVFSFEVAQNLFGSALEMLRFTQSYSALDLQTVEWLSIPGYQGAYATHFFSPLPRHLWNILRSEEMLTSEISTRIPIGWGAYVIDEWISGDHITLSRNDNYFRIGDGLPKFDFLVFRFVDDAQAAVDALLVGECDYVDQTALTNVQIERLLELQENGLLKFHYQLSESWEQALFGIDSLQEDRLNLFAEKEARQAVAMCIDRQALVDELFMGQSDIPDSYLVADHTLFNSDVNIYEFNPSGALELLASIGWVDYDQNPDTPLTSVGIEGLPDGTVFEFDYLIPDDMERQQAAKIIKSSLAQCGIKANLDVQDWEQFLSPGPDGQVFGRTFEMTQFAWAESQTSACFLFKSEEISGPYPEFAKGWGGSNLAGYNNPEFDQACRTARNTLPDLDENRQAHYLAQTIFFDELPAIPLYWQPKLMAMRPDMCSVSSGREIVFNLAVVESFNYHEGCE